MTGYMKEKGFTLLEVLIAVFILALMSLIIWQITNNTYRGTSKAEKYDAIYQNARLALKRVTGDLSMAFLVSANMQGRFPDGSVSFEPVFIGEDTGDSDKVDFVSFSNQRLVKNEKASDQIEVGYYVADCPDKEEKVSCLMRRSSTYVDKDIKEGGDTFPAAEGIKKFNLEYYDKEKAEWRGGWDSKDPAYLNKLPRAVRVTISFDDPSGEEEEIIFTESVEIPLSTAPLDF